jgi:hypothetical protein
MKATAGLSMLVLLAAACDGATGPGNGGNVAIRFGSAAAASARGDLIPSGLSADELTVTGTNGTLVLQDVRFIVEELKLRSSGDVATCDDDNDANDDRSGRGDLRFSADRGRDHAEDDNDENGDDCEFEGGPFIVDLPLEGDATIATENIPPGTYDSFRFRIDDLEQGDDDEDDDRARTPGLLSGMRAVYPNFPSRASLVVKGTQNGQPFTVYFRSKIRISQAIVPPLTIPGDDVLTVKIDPSAWFKLGSQVLDLASLNGQLIELGDHVEAGIEGSHRGRH